MYAYATLLIVILSYRIDTAFFRFGSKEGMLNKAFSSAFIPLLVTTSFAVLLITLFKDSISEALQLGSYPHYFQWFAIIIALDVLALIPFAKLRLEEKPAKFMLYRVFNILFTIGIIFYFFEIYDIEDGWLNSIFPSIQLKVDLVFIANLIASSLLLLFLLVELKGIRLKVDWKLWKKMVAYSSPLIIVGVANSINQFFAAPLQHAFLPYTPDENLAQAGIYSAAMRIAALLVMFNTAFNYAAEPFFFNNAAKTKDTKIYGKVILLYALISSVVVLGIVYFLDILQFIVGKNYREAMFIVPILLLAYLMLGFYYNISIWYKLADKTYFGSIISIVGSIITLMASSLLLPVLGYVASAWAALACYTVMVMMAFVTGQKHYKIEYPVNQILAILISVIILILVCLWINTFDLTIATSIIIKGFIFSVAVLFLLYYFRSIIKELFYNHK